MTQNFDANQSSIMKGNDTLNFTNSFIEDSILKPEKTLEVNNTIKVIDEEKGGKKKRGEKGARRRVRKGERQTEERLKKKRPLRKG